MLDDLNRKLTKDEITSFDTKYYGNKKRMHSYKGKYYLGREINYIGVGEAMNHNGYTRL